MSYRTSRWQYFLIVVSLLPAMPAIAAADCSADPDKYCFCIYEKALEDLQEMQGNSQATIKQRVQAIKKALDQCLGKGTDKVTDDIKNIKK